MFYSCGRFNQNINSWDVSNVREMSNMFFNCDVFNQPLSGWNISNVNKFDNFMGGSNVKSYSPDYLGQIYAQWSTLSVKPIDMINFTGIKYNPKIGYKGREDLINLYNWSITDGGPTS
jgi:surface protein